MVKSSKSSMAMEKEFHVWNPLSDSNIRMATFSAMCRQLGANSFPFRQALAVVSSILQPRKLLMSVVVTLWLGSRGSSSKQTGNNAIQTDVRSRFSGAHIFVSDTLKVNAKRHVCKCQMSRATIAIN